jgi:hypothetical protein
MAEMLQCFYDAIAGSSKEFLQISAAGFIGACRRRWQRSDRRAELGSAGGLVLWAGPLLKQEEILPKAGAWRDHARVLEARQLPAGVGAAGTGAGEAVPKPAARTPKAGIDPKTVRTHEPRVYTPANSGGTGSGETLARRNEGNTGTGFGKPNFKEPSAGETGEAHPGKLGKTLAEAGIAIRV